MRSIATTPFLFAMIISLAVQAGSGEWSLARDKDDIKVYTRKHDSYSYDEYKGITVMKGEISEVIDLLKNAETYDDWSFRVVENTARLLKFDESTREYYIYQEIKAPIVSNRDVIAVYKFHPPENDGSVLVEFRGDPDFIPKKNGKVRIPELYGYWKLVPVSDGKIKVVHQAFSHPGGSPPALLVNKQNVEAPYSMLKKIREIVQR